jgi:hypothetical protein
MTIIGGRSIDDSLGAAERRGRASLGIGLSITPVVVGIAALAVPTLHVGIATAGVIAFGGAISTAMLGITISSIRDESDVVRGTVAGAAALTLAVIAFVQARFAAAAIVVDAALVAGAWAVGASIGRRVQHPGHLLPACVVVGAVDLGSVLSSFGPSRAIAASERALSMLAVSFPVPGSTAFAPALGVGDLVFIALVLGAVAAHRLPLVRAAVLCFAGTAVAGAMASLLETAIPALVPIGAALVLGLPAVRNLRPEDRRSAKLAMSIAVSIAVATTLSRLMA